MGESCLSKLGRAKKYTYGNSMIVDPLQNSIGGYEPMSKRIGISSTVTLMQEEPRKANFHDES
jgi:hypothetical protein